jgi:hypothetical protein
MQVVENEEPMFRDGTGKIGQRLAYVVAWVAFLHDPSRWRMGRKGPIR